MSRVDSAALMSYVRNECAFSSANLPKLVDSMGYVVGAPVLLTNVRFEFGYDSRNLIGYHTAEESRACRAEMCVVECSRRFAGYAD